MVGYGEPIPLNEPKLCPIFSEKVKTQHPWQKDLVFDEILMKDLDIPAAAYQARMPVKTAEEVKPLPISENEIESLYTAALEWYTKQK